MLVVRGPRENGHRPAVDVLFRSAAREFGPRVIGVVFSGQLDCGSAGMTAIRAGGGLTIVQDPDVATFPDMPSNVLQHMPVDHLLPARGIGLLLAQLAGSEVPPRRVPKGVALASEPSELQRAHNALMHGEQHVPRRRVEGIRLSPVTCPECHGSMLEATTEQGFSRFQCHVGHAFSLDSLAAEQEHAMEDALWASVRALEESESLARRMAAGSEPRLSARFRERAEAMKHHAETIRRILMADRILPTREEEEEGAQRLNSEEEGAQRH